MSLFQKSVLKHHLSNLDENIIQQSWKIYQSYFLDPSKQKIIFEKKEEELQMIKSEIDKTDKEIDQMVYELYGLTKEEIEIVENATK